MNIEKQVCSLEQAKRLKELGISQTSIATYFTTSIEPLKPILLYTAQQLGSRDYSAFTVAELGVMLPMGKDKHGRHINMLTYKNCLHRVHFVEKNCDIICGYEYYSEAQARASMLIYLLDKMHITSKEVNKRLKAIS